MPGTNVVPLQETLNVPEKSFCAFDEVVRVTSPRFTTVGETAIWVPSGALGPLKLEDDEAERFLKIA